MKEAQLPNRIHPVTASREAPSEAFCPDCGAVVRLRQRKIMDGTIIFYWRHVANSGNRCPRRKRPFG